MLTRKRVAQLAREGSRYGSYRIDAQRMEYPCPLQTEQLGGGHRVTVWHQVWERVSAAQILKAFTEHYLNEYPEDRCPFLDKDGDELWSYRFRQHYVKDAKKNPNLI